MAVKYKIWNVNDTKSEILTNTKSEMLMLQNLKVNDKKSEMLSRVEMRW